MAGLGRGNADEALALAVATGQTLRDAAAATGLSERTARRRWGDAAFRRRVADMRGDMITRALGKMADGMAEAADQLRMLLMNAKSESVRLGAARAMLELGARLWESVELEQRIAAVEEMMDHD